MTIDDAAKDIDGESKSTYDVISSRLDEVSEQPNTDLAFAYLASVYNEISISAALTIAEQIRRFPIDLVELYYDNDESLEGLVIPGIGSETIRHLETLARKDLFLEVRGVQGIRKAYFSPIEIQLEIAPPEVNPDPVYSLSIISYSQFEVDLENHPNQSLSVVTSSDLTYHQE